VHIRTGRALLWNDVISVVELNLSEIAKWCSGTPNDALCPCAGFERLVNRRHKVSPRGLSQSRVILWLVDDLVLPIGQEDEVKGAIMKRYRGGRIDGSMFSLISDDENGKSLNMPRKTYLESSTKIMVDTP